MKIVECLMQDYSKSNKDILALISTKTGRQIIGISKINTLFILAEFALKHHYVTFFSSK